MLVLTVGPFLSHVNRDIMQMSRTLRAVLSAVLVLIVHQHLEIRCRVQQVHTAMQVPQLVPHALLVLLVQTHQTPAI